jgi:multidrug resistance efflux pump
MERNGRLMKFKEIKDFHESQMFFNIQPVPAIRNFLVILVVLIAGAVSWSCFFKMDDILKVQALLIPARTISSLRSSTVGEVIQKNYKNDESVEEGTCLLKVDINADQIELDNSAKLMARMVNDIAVYNLLMKTIQKNAPVSMNVSGEAAIRSASYLAEYERQKNQIELNQIKLDRERDKPDNMSAKQNIEDLEKNLQQSKLAFISWRDNLLVDTMNTLKTLTQNKDSLERRIADLDRNIRNASLFAPISGRINEIKKINVGDTIFSGEEILQIIPQNDEKLKADLAVDPAYIARLKVGYKVLLRFPGLPPSRFGQLEAKVDLIPPDFILGSDNKPVFIVESIIDNPWLYSSKGDKIKLLPGISAEGRIILEQDTVMYMLLKKLDFIR